MRHRVFKHGVLALILTGALVAIAHGALAQSPGFTNPLGDITLPGILETVLRYMLGLVGILTLGALTWGGVLYIISLGDDTRIKQAKTIIFWAVAGLGVVILSYVIIATVAGFLGVSE